MSKLNNLHQAHLEWMYENQPDLVRQLSRQGKLRPHLENKEQQALAARDRTLSQGHPADVAQEVMMSVLSPPDGPATRDDPAPQAVPLREQRVIERQLDPADQ